MRISSFSAVSILLVMPLGCGSESETGNDFTAGAGGSSALGGSSGAGPAGSGGKAGTGGTGGSTSAGSGGTTATGGTTASGGSSGSATSTGGSAGTGTTAGAGGTSASAGGGQGGSGNTGGMNAGAGGSAGSSAGAGGATAGSGGNAGAGEGGVGGKAGMSGAGGKGAAGSGGALANCTSDGNITYTLARNANPTAQEQMAYDRITTAMDRALEYYNCYTNISRALTVQYNPSVQTADGNPNGNIRFGSMDSMNYITAMHETSHVLGVGDNAYDALIVNGIFTGPAATAEIREIDNDPEAQVHGDNQHFWPYGLNYVSEVTGESDLLAHMRIVVAIREDIGL